ncbi:hypothetical protein HGE68_07495 [Rhodobacteraceae bacterium R_SAG6]|nr:hypothetical protein [Rhodobacteraceae bacterium R_SAG6]
MIYALLAVMGRRLIPICAIHPHRNALSPKAKYLNACWFMSSCQVCDNNKNRRSIPPDPVPYPQAAKWRYMRDGGQSSYD